MADALCTTPEGHGQVGAPSLDTSTIRAPHPETWCKKPFLPEASSPIINQSPEPADHAHRGVGSSGPPDTWPTGGRRWLEPRTLCGEGRGALGGRSPCLMRTGSLREGPRLRRGLGDAPLAQECQLDRAFEQELSEGLPRGRGRLSAKEGGGRPVTGVWGLSSFHTPGNPEKQCEMPRRLRQM